MFIVRQDMGVLQIEFNGSLNCGTVERLRNLVDASGIKDRGIVFDMGCLELGTPEALWELISLLLELEQQEIPVELRRVGPELGSLLKLLEAPGFTTGEVSQ
jgi:hypothetical protein